MKPMRVLMVDDEPDFLDLMRKRMAKRQADVLVAPDGPSAVRMVKEHAPDVVVLDVKMPGMDGIETLREIRALDPKAQVIMLTGHADVETAMKGMELGAFDYMMKPMSFDELFQKCQEGYALRKLGTDKT